MIYVTFKPSVLLKGKRAPIGATSKDGTRRKVADGVWVPAKRPVLVFNTSHDLVAGLEGHALESVLSEVQSRLVMEFSNPREQSRLAEVYVFLYGKRLLERGADRSNTNVQSYLRHRGDPEFYRRVNLGEFAYDSEAA